MAFLLGRKIKFSKASEDKTKKKFYCLEMFPYPSGDSHGACKKLHSW